MAARFDTDALADEYAAAFDERTRAVHVACLEHAILTRDDKWPTVETCTAFAALYDLPGAPIAAFFGYVGYSTGSKSIWVDVLRGPGSGQVARLLATPEQASALGAQRKIADAFAGAAGR